MKKLLIIILSLIVVNTNAGIFSKVGKDFGEKLADAIHYFTDAFSRGSTTRGTSGNVDSFTIKTTSP